MVYVKSHIRRLRSGKATKVKAHQRKPVQKIPVKKGRMLGYDVDWNSKKRHAHLEMLVRRYGPTSVWRMLNAQVTFRKHKRDRAWKIFKEDRCWIEKQHKIGDQIC